MYASHKSLIHALGGYRLVAETLGAEPDTVRQWLFRQKIPRTVWPEILIAYPQVSLWDLMALEDAASEPVTNKTRLVNARKAVSESPAEKNA